MKQYLCLVESKLTFSLLMFTLTWSVSAFAAGSWWECFTPSGETIVSTNGAPSKFVEPDMSSVSINKLEGKSARFPVGLAFIERWTENSAEYFRYRTQLKNHQYDFVFNRISGTNIYAEMIVSKDGILIEQDGVCKNKGF